MNAKIFDFHGGIHPAECKELSNRTPIQHPPLPSRLILPLSQHIGSAAEPLVAAGERVLKGQKIAEATGYISAPVHAPTSGVVSFIGPQPFPHASGMPAPAIVIEADGQDEWAPITPRPDYREMEPDALVGLIRDAGINGLGGAGFPTAVKLCTQSRHHIDTLIINGTECEPYITADDLLMRERAAELVAGIEILAHLLTPRQVLIGIEDNKPEAIAAVRAAVGQRPFEVRVFPTKYPSGGEKQLIQILTGQEVPSGKLPADIGVLCQNVGTCVAVHDAVLLGRPLISRITTLTGEALAKPMNVEALIGTPARELLAFAGLDEKKMDRLIMGGPMMGFTLPSLDVPVIKTSNCLLAPTTPELPPPPPAMPCIRCGECAEVCPATLLPQQLHFFALGEDVDQLKAHNLFDCIECGACAYVCPSSIPLVQYYRAAKADIRDQEQKAKKAEYSKQRFEQRQDRLRRAEEQKEAERKARAEKAARAKAAQADAPAEAVAKVQAQKPGLSDEQKKLKIEASMAQVALKKAEKQLAAHATPELEAQVAELRAAAEAAQKALDAALPAEPAPAPTAASSDAAKKARIEAAMLKAQIRKLEKVEAPSEEQQAELAQLKAKLAEQEKLLDAAPAAAPAAKPAGDDAAKKAKIEAAMLKAQIRKLEKVEAPSEEQQAELAQLKAKLAEQEKLLDAAPAAPTAKPAGDDAAKKAKIEAAMLKAQIRKLEKVEAPSEEQQAELAQLKAKLAEQEKLLDAAPAAPAAKPAGDDAAKKAKIEAAMLKAQIRKLEKVEAPSEEQQAELAQLKAKLEEAEHALSRLEQAPPAPEAEAPKAVDPLKKAKVELAMTRAELKKAEKAGADDSEVARLREALAAAEQALHAAEDSCGKPAPERVLMDKKGPVDETLRSLKTEVAFARADLRKLERDTEAPADALNAARERLARAEQALEAHLTATAE